MSVITPVPLNPSQALITPGYPLVTVEKSSPLDTMALNTTPAANATGPAQSTKKQTAVAQANHQNDRSA